MNKPVSHRMTIDEIQRNRDGDLVATLVDDDGREAIVPLDLLPEGARLNQVVSLEFSIDESSTEQRRAHIQRLQQRLFQRRGECE